MKLKYYLRGLGIGIIVTAVIMGVSSGHRKETLSDREIKERAAALGMVEQGNLLADLETPSESPIVEEESPQDKETPEAALVTSSEATPVTTPAEEEDVVQPEMTPTEEPAKEPEEIQEETPEDSFPESDSEPAELTGEGEENADNTSEENITIQILSGEGSYAVCRKLEEAGLIASASDFDAYLYTNGYDRKIRIGSYQVPVGAEPATIAAILTHEQ